MITFDGDQTLYSDGSNFDSNPSLASYLCQLLKQGVVVAVVTAAGYEYNAEKYEFRLSGLLNYFKAKKLTAEQCERFLLFGGECNYLLTVSSHGFKIHIVSCVTDKVTFLATSFILCLAAGKGLQASSSEREWARWLDNCYKISSRFSWKLG
jgi:IMP and pyridine-specific 5'-nucleotidase